jgi:clan AA aspartic protease (TIGR02281 family)
MLVALALSGSAVAEEIELVEKQAGTFMVLGEINDQVKKYFIVDSGATDVSLPAEVVATLFPETLRSDDFLVGGTYRLADGRTVSSRRFRIRSLRIGHTVFRDVPASIAEPGSPLLLGQSVLRRVTSWRIDNDRRILVLEGEPKGDTPPAVPEQPPANVSLPPALPPGLPFPIGTPRDEVRARLGPPIEYKDRAYWHNTTSDKFGDIVPGWMIVAYIYDVNTLRVRQSEAVLYAWPSFEGWDSVDYLMTTLGRMAGQSVGPSGRRAIEALALGERKAEFSSGQLRGVLERQDVRRIYLAVWEHDLHKR